MEAIKRHKLLTLFIIFAVITFLAFMFHGRLTELLAPASNSFDKGCGGYMSKELGGQVNCSIQDTTGKIRSFQVLGVALAGTIVTGTILLWRKFKK